MELIKYKYRVKNSDIESFVFACSLADAKKKIIQMLGLVEIEFINLEK